ncbi:MAG: hypothetical protein GTO02_20780, partial [Candidatus Dadabacteria bacterium]|nr:hypothetical protein [Candidatus Dadabacteria bacterium]NIQ16726.1 hypothetical protein [Candidatus Dadabacteria bacterium]
VGDDDDNLGGDDDNDVDEPIGDPNGDGGDDAIDGGGTAGEPDFGCSATDCTPIIGNTSSSGIVSSDPFNENLFVTNLCNSISIVDDNMANDVIINNGANIPVWAMTTFNPTDCSCRAFGSGTGSAAGFNNVLVEMDLFFDLLDGTFEGEASYNGSTGSQFPAVGYDCEGTFFSDKRLKNNLNLVHTFENGINLYSFNYNDNNEQMYIGVMAQDLNNMGLEHSVVTMPNGYYAVDYNKLGLRMTTLEEWEEKGLDSVVIDNNY